MMIEVDVIKQNRDNKTLLLKSIFCGREAWVPEDFFKPNSSVNNNGFVDSETFDNYFQSGLTFRGDEEYNIECSGACFVGDEVAFETGDPDLETEKYEILKGKIIKKSFIKTKGSYKTFYRFVLEIENGREKIKTIDGPDMARRGTFRKQWIDELARQISDSDDQYFL